MGEVKVDSTKNQNPKQHHHPYHAVSSTAIRSIEDAIERLKCLNYETHFVRDLEQKRVYPDAFIAPATNTALQYNHYIALVQWLFSILEHGNGGGNGNENGKKSGSGSRRGHDRDDDLDLDRLEFDGGVTADITAKNTPVTPFRAEEYEDPNAIAQRLMYSLRSIDFPLESFPIVKLKQPYGEIACSILDFLTMRAMEALDMSFQEPMLPQQADNDDNGGNGGNGDGGFGFGEEIDEIDNEGDDDDDGSNGFTSSDDGSMGDSSSTHMNDMHDPRQTSKVMASHSSPSTDITARQYPKVDPVEWKRELERVGPLLLGQNFGNHDDSNNNNTTNANSGGDNFNWRMHVNHFVEEYDTFLNESDASRSAIERLCTDATASLERIESREKIIATHDTFQKMATDHRTVTSRIHELKKSMTESTEALDAARDDIQSLSRQLAKVRAMIDERGSSMTNTNPLVRIKTALQNIKSEIRDYDLEIGVLEHTLLHKRLESHNNNNRMMKHKGSSSHINSSRADVQ